MAHTLPPLPYAKDALVPYLSEEALSFHHEKHHQAYVTNLNKLIEGTPFENQSLEETILNSANKSDKIGIFNNAAQIWNHTFYWHCMKPNGGGTPSGDLLQSIVASFGSFESFCDQFHQAALTQFGSGWAWLIKNANGSLEILKTGNADLPMAHGKTALLTVDVWEHAYYIDYRNRRPDYVKTFLDKLVNWDFVNSCFEAK